MARRREYAGANGQRQAAHGTSPRSLPRLLSQKTGRNRYARFQEQLPASSRYTPNRNTKGLSLLRNFAVASPV